ncbi:MAG: dihydroxyacetone kinase subunit L [Corynebacteriales bacterium]|nr:dihydroxyacetone kinase subunit L [Mycobacteriales bacterium]
MIDAAWMRDALTRYAKRITEQREYLIELDSAIGDADHGANMDRGMQAVVVALADKPGNTPAEVLKTAATTLISKVGGAAGPLYGTALLRASIAVGDQQTLDGAATVTALVAARDGIVARGKAEIGDKTMVDAWEPAVLAAQDAAATNSPVKEILSLAAQAAEQGAEGTIPLIARKGRASYLGERSAGHQDPGATSSAMFLRALADTAAENSGAAT